jgi:hypothetical protein
MKARSDSGPLLLARETYSEFSDPVEFKLTSRAGYVKIRPNRAQGVLDAQERLIPSPQASAPPGTENWQRLQGELLDTSEWA